MSQRPRTAVSLLVAAFSINVVYAMSTQVQEKFHVFVQGPRPVADAVLRLSRETGWAITYEDPMWLDPADRIELQRPSRSDKSLPKTYVHRDGLIDVDIPPRAGISVEDQKRLAVQDILTAAEVRLMSERFSIQERGGMLHVVPVAAKDAKGVMHPYSSTLDARISMPLFQGNAIDAFAAVVDAVAEGSQRKVRPGAVPFNVLGRANVSISADREVARDVILRLLTSVKADLSWQLLCQPGVESCFFNLYVVGKSAR